MSDFYQNGIVTVLHRLGAANLERLEADLRRQVVEHMIVERAQMQLAKEMGVDTFGDVTVDGEGQLLPQARVLRDVVEAARAIEPSRARTYESLMSAGVVRSSGAAPGPGGLIFMPKSPGSR